VPFYLRKDARSWFKHIQPAVELDFDLYYFCLMAGLSVARKEKVSLEQTTELTDSYPGRYREKGRLLTALFLSRELKLLGIDESERGTLHSTIHSLIDPLSASHLSEAGMRELNRYSWGGFEVLTEWFEDQPRSLTTFLLLFQRRLNAALAARA